MIQTSLRPCSPVDFGELLTIGGNCSFGNGVLVFDNISDYGFDPAPGKRLANILVKLRPDILVICMQGCLEFILDCSNPVLLQPGDMALFQQGQIVEFNETDQTAKLYVIAFPHDITLGINGIDTMGINGDGVLFRPSPKFRDKLINLYSLIRETLEDREIMNQKDIVNYLTRILMVYLSNIMSAKAKTYTNHSYNSHVRREKILYNQFIKLVKDNFKSHREVTYYAGQMCMTPGHLSRIVKTVSGKSVSEWIRNYVILEAKVLLKSSDLPINEISEALNFANPSFFSKYFRKQTGLTPNRFRNQSCDTT